MSLRGVNKTRIKRGSSADWAANDLVLRDGEPGIDEDLDIMKVGDGVRRWSELDIAGGGGPGGGLSEAAVRAIVEDAVGDLPAGGGGDGLFRRETAYPYSVDQDLPAGALLVMDDAPGHQPLKFFRVEAQPDFANSTPTTAGPYRTFDGATLGAQVASDGSPYTESGEYGLISAAVNAGDPARYVVKQVATAAEVTGRVAVSASIQNAAFNQAAPVAICGDNTVLFLAGAPVRVNDTDFLFPITPAALAAQPRAAEIVAVGLVVIFNAPTESFVNVVGGLTPDDLKVAKDITYGLDETAVLNLISTNAPNVADLVAKTDYDARQTAIDQQLLYHLEFLGALLDGGGIASPVAVGTTTAHGSGVSSLTVGVPADAAAGDIVVVFVGADYPTAPVQASGLAVLSRTDVAYHNSAVLVGPADNLLGGQVSVEVTGGSNMNVHCVAIRGVQSIDGVRTDSTGPSAVDTYQVPASLASKNAMVLQFASARAGTALAAPDPLNPLTTTVEGSTAAALGYVLADGVVAAGALFNPDANANIAIASLALAGSPARVTAPEPPSDGGGGELPGGGGGLEPYPPGNGLDGMPNEEGKYGYMTDAMGAPPGEVGAFTFDGDNNDLVMGLGHTTNFSFDDVPYAIPADGMVQPNNPGIRIDAPGDYRVGANMILTATGGPRAETLTGKVTINRIQTDPFGGGELLAIPITMAPGDTQIVVDPAEWKFADFNVSGQGSSYLYCLIDFDNPEGRIYQDMDYTAVVRFSLATIPSLPMGT